MAKLIIFDMDNTILHSHIDFPRMKAEVFAAMHRHGLDAYQRATVGLSLDAYASSADYDAQLEKMLWQVIADVELDGMQNATAEPGIIDVLARLQGHAILTVLTNNSDANLAEQLGRIGILPYLDYVCGRDSTGALKPSPQGMLNIIARYQDVSRTLAIGDAYIDAAAAAAAKADIGFVAYNRSREEKWHERGVQPLLCLREWNELSTQSLLNLLEGS